MAHQPREVKANYEGFISEQVLFNYFQRFGSLKAKNVKVKRGPNGAYFACVKYDDTNGFQRALSTSAHYVRGVAVRVQESNAERRRQQVVGIADYGTLSEADTDLCLFGNFEGYTGFRYALNNDKVGKIDDVFAAAFMELSDSIPSVISDDTNAIDALIAAEEQLEQFTRSKNANDVPRAKLHWATYVRVLTALEEYSGNVDTTKLRPPSKKILYVPNAPISTTYAQVKNRFAGSIHDVIWMRRGIDFTACAGYYVLFKPERDAMMGERHQSDFPAVPTREDDSWHKLFWKCFRRRSLLFTATINNYSLPSRALRSSYKTTARHNAFGKALAALPADHPVFGIAEVQREAPVEDEFAEWPLVLRPSKHNEHAQPSAANDVSSPTTQGAQQPQPVAENEPEQPRVNTVNLDESAMRRDLAFNLYQLYGDCAFFKQVNYRSRRKMKPLTNGSRVSYGYVLRSCDAWLETARLCDERRRATDATDYIKDTSKCIEKFLRVTDRMYDARRRFGHNLCALWKDKIAPNRADDGVVHGDPTATLVPPTDWRIIVIDDATGLEEVAKHLEQLDEQCNVSLDTEGGGSPYSDETLQMIQIATSRKFAFILDVRACRTLPAIRRVGEQLLRMDRLKFGQAFNDADAEKFWTELQVDGGAVPVHEARQFVLKVMGMSPEAAQSPGLANVARFVLHKDLPKDAQMSHWWFSRPFTDRQIRYASMDVIVIIMMLEECQRRFPRRYARRRETFLQMQYAQEFDLKNWNANAARYVPLPHELTEDDPVDG